MRLGWKLPLESLSATSLGAMIQCPEQFRQKYLLKTEETMFGSRFIGIVDHKVSESLVAMKLNGDEPVPIDALYKHVWNGLIERHGDPDWQEDDPVKMQERGVKMAHAYAEQILPNIKPVATEERFEFKVAGVPVKVIGYLDIIEDGKIRERKTTAVKTTKPKAKWRFQGIVYGYAVGMPLQWDVVTRQATPQVFSADFQDGLRMSLYPDLRLNLQDPRVARQLIRDAAWRMNDLYARYGPNNIWPMEGMFSSDWLCDYCPIGPKYKRTCLAWQ